MRLKLDARTRRLLRRLPVVNVYSIAELALLAGLAVQSARLVWTLVTPVSPLGDWRPADIQVPGQPADVLASFDPFFRLGGGATPAPTAVTALQLMLYGIRVDEASGRGSAIVAGPDAVQKSVGVGEEIIPGVTLKAVAFDHITIDRGGAAEDLFLTQDNAPAAGQTPGAPAPAQGGAAPAATPAIQAGQLRNEIGFIPRIDGGPLTGLVVRPQGTGALFRASGLREGDVIVSIGGRPVSGPQDIDRVTADFAKGGNIPISVERGTETLPLAITVVATP
jgi:general secretion pathway protein C